MMKPKRQFIGFPGQREDEIIFVYSHHHLFRIIPFLVICIILYAVPVVAVMIMGISGVTLMTEGKDIAALLAGLYWLIVSFVFMVSWIGYYYDLYIVTDRRIISIDQHRLFSRNIKEISFEAIQDVDTVAHNFWQVQFNYGDIIVRTSADNTSFPLKDIPSPKKVAFFITDLLEQTRKGIEPVNRKARGNVLAYINGVTVYPGDHIPAVVNIHRDLNAVSSDDIE